MDTARLLSIVFYVTQTIQLIWLSCEYFYKLEPFVLSKYSSYKSLCVKMFERGLQLSSNLKSFAGDVPRVDGQLAVARAFGDKSLKRHLSSEPDVSMLKIDEDTEFIILASDGIWKVSHFNFYFHGFIR